MDSFYGGHQGASFVIKARFKTIKEMEAAFSRGTAYRDVWFGEYCIIDTVNKNDPDNGKIFRRGAEYAKIADNDDMAGDPIEIGQIVGPSSGIPFIAFTTIEDISTLGDNTHGYGAKNRPLAGPITNIYDDNGNVIQRVTNEQRLYPTDNDYYYDYTNEGINDPDLKINDLTVARDEDGKIITNDENGQLVSGQTHDSIKWTWCNIRMSDSDSYPYNTARVYIGFQVPYHYFETTGTQSSPYDDEGVYRGPEDAHVAVHSYNTIGGKENPFSHKIDFKVPAGIPGISYTDFTVVTFENDSIQLYRPEDLEFHGNGQVPYVTAGENKSFTSSAGHRAMIACLRCFDQIENPQPIYEVVTKYNTQDDPVSAYLALQTAADSGPELGTDGHVRAVWVYLGEYDQPRAGTKILPTPGPNSDITIIEHLSSLTDDGTLILYDPINTTYTNEVGNWWESNYEYSTVLWHTVQG